MRNAIETIGGEAVRYGVAIMLGLAVDLTFANALAGCLAIPTLAAAAAGFVAGLACNFLMFERWVFRTNRIGWIAFGRLAVASSGTLALRLAAVAALIGLTVPRPFALVGAAGISSIINFLLVRWLAYRH